MSTFGEDLIQSLGAAVSHAQGNGPAVSLLHVIAREPEAVKRALLSSEGASEDVGGVRRKA